MKKKQAPVNYRIIAVVIVLAIAFWFVVKMNNRFDHTVDIPLHLMLNNPEFVLKHPAPKTIRVKFSGRGIDLLRLRFYAPVYEVDLSSVQTNITMNLADLKEYVRISDDIKVDVKSIVTPHEMTFEVDRRTARKVPLTVHSLVQTEPGFTLVETQTTPDSILVTGPACYVDTLSGLDAAEMTYRNIKSAFSDKQSLVYNRDFYAIYSPEKANVHFNVQRLAEKEIADVAVEVINVDSGYEVVPLPARVRVYAKGGEKILAEAGKDDFRVTIDFRRDWQPGAKKVGATVESNLQLLYSESQPRLFELIVQKKRIRTE